MLVCFLAAAAVSWAQNQTAQLRNDGNGVYVLIPKGEVDDPTTSVLDLADKSVGYSFKIYDESGPDADYDNNWEGKLLITAPEGCVIQLSGTVITESTLYDWLEVYDGASDESTKLGDKFGSPENSEENAVNVTGSSHNMLLFFRSDGSNVDAGVDLTATLIGVGRDKGFVWNSSTKELLAYTGEGGNIVIPSAITAIGNGVFANNSSITSVDFSQATGLTTIGVRAFADCDALTEITIPATVETIGEGAFSGIINVNYPADGPAADVNDDNWGAAARNGIIDGDFVFNAGRTILIKYFGDDEEVVIPGTVTEIAANAFYDCDIIDTVDFSQATGLTTIGDYAFAYCDALTEITIPATVETIGEGAFSGIINVNYPADGTAADTNNDNWGAAARNGVIDGDFVFNTARTVLVKYIGDDEDVVIPSTVTEIAAEAFYDCDFIETVDYSQATGLTTIGVRAFSYCDVLTSITIPASVETIGDEAFYECYNLKTIDLSGAESLSTIGEDAFADCDALTEITIPASVETIGNYAFGSCDALKTVDLSGATGLRTIGESAFCSCDALTSIAIPASVETIGNRAFYDCNKLTTVDLSGATSLTAIGEEAFADCGALTEITIPATVETIGNYTFGYCGALKNIDLSGATGLRTIGQYAFADCSIISVDVPETVTTIGVSAFSNVNNINYTGTAADEYSDNWGAAVRNGQVGNFIYDDSEHKSLVGCTVTHGSVEIPAGVEYIGYRIFKNNVNVSVTIPSSSSVTAIESEAFRGVANIINNSTYNTDEPWGAKNNNKTVDGDFVYADNTKTTIVGYIGEGGNIEIPAGVGAIGDHAFSGSSSLTAVDFSKTTGLSIGDYAFSGCGLTEVTIPANVSSLGIVIFEGNTNLALINCEFSVVKSSEVSDNRWFWKDGGGSSYPVRWQCSDWQLSDDGVLTVKANINYDSYDYYPWYDFSSQIESVEFGSNVTAIGAYAFNDYDALTSVTIPASVESIGYEAFRDCQNLETATLSSNSSLQTIGTRAFYGCNKLGNNNLDNATGLVSIGEQAFYNCDGMTTVTIPASVTTMENSVFSSCDNLSVINCYAEKRPEGWDGNWNGSSAKVMWDFTNWSLSDEGVLSFNKNYNFENADDYPWYSLRDQVTGLDLGQNVTVIGNNAFYGCDALAEVTIPSSVTSISEYAFAYCSALETVDLTGATGLTVIGEYAFHNCDALTGVAIPSSVTTISEYAFANSDILETVDLSGATSLATIGNYAFSECNTLGNVVIPASVETIGERAFYDCAALTAVTIPAGVQTMGSQVFYGCDNLSVICCEAESKPEGWGGEWNYGVFNGSWKHLPVAWDCTNWSLSEEGVLTVRKNYDYDSSSDYPWYELREQITAVEFAGNVTTIGDYAFYDYNNLQLATMPAGFTTIGGYAFSNCGNLKMVDLSNTTSLATIGNYAFSGCSNLQSLTIPATVTTIGERAFYDCQKLETIDLSELTSLVEIGDYAFYNCDALTAAVTVPASVETIGECAFSYCDALTVITIPASVQTVGSQVFCGSDNLSIIYCEAESKPDGWNDYWNYGVFNGSWEYLPVAWDFTNWSLSASGKLTIKKEYTAEGAEGYPWHQLRSQITSVEYDNSKATFTTIGNYAFYGCGNLTAIEIPASVESIGNYAFSGCNTLGNVVIPASVETIGERAFYNCYALTEITIPARVQTMGSRVFYGCDYLSVIYCEAESKPEGWGGEWNYGVFNGSWEYLPVLWDCNNLSLSDDGMLTVTKDYEFDSYDEYPWYSFAELIKGVTFESGVSVIGDYAFYNNSNNTYPNLATVVIPATVTEIGEEAFSGSRNLTTADLKGAYSLTTIGAFAFYSCGLTEITIPANVTAIGDEAFEYCNNVESINLNSAGSLESIGVNAFYDCFKTINIDVPSNVTYIGDNAFYNIKNLKYNGSYGSSSDTWGALARNAYVDGDFIFSDGTKTCLLGYTGNGGNITIPSTVVTIYDMAFYQKENITGVVISGNVMTIGSNAFADCPNLATLNLSNATSLTTIGSVAFDGCNALTSVIVPSTVTYIESGAFSNCENLKTVNLNNATNLKTIEGHAFYGCKALKSITIPATVTTIGNYAFSYCNALESITIPASVTSIGQYAFGYCEKLASADLSNSTNLEYIGGDGAFYGCIALKSIVIPSKVKTIGNYAFKGCTSLQTVNLNNATSLREIYSSAFENCSSLATIDLSKAINLENIYSNAFSDCDALTQVTIPAKVRGIDYAVFSGCDNLRTVNLNNAKNLTYISDYAFHNCTLLTSAVVIPEKVNHIGYGAFEGCSALSSVSIPDGIVHVGDEAFAGCSNLTFKQENGYRYLGNSQNPYVVLVGVVDPNNMGNVSNNVKTVAAGAFENCETFPTTADGACYVGNSSNPHLILARAESEEISSCTINSNTRIIAPYAFMNCYNLSSVDIPLGVMHVGFYAFYDNGSSPVINCHTGDMAQWDPDWEDGCEVNKAVGGWEFDGESGLLTVKTNVECEDFDYYPWYDLINSIKEVQFTDDVSYIGDYAFYNYDELTKVTIPASVTSIGNGAFDYCDNLATVDFSNASGLESIGEYAFAFIYSLPEADLSGATNLKSIGRYAFYNDYHLNKIVIPASVLEIGEYVFVYVNSNTKILCEGNGPAEGWDSNWTWNSIIWHYNNNTLSLSTNNSSYGSVVTNTVNDEDVNQVISNHTYTYGDVVEIEAVRNGGNIFLRWSDGNTTNPRTITITDNLSLEAVFGNNGTVYTVNVWTNQSSWGTVTGTGNGNYISGDLVELVAEPAEHYHFAYWSDDEENTNPNRSFNIDGNVSFYAVFEPAPCTVTVNVTGQGTVDSENQYGYGTWPTINSYPADGWYLAYWTTPNGNAFDGSYSFGVYEDMTLTAVFKPVQNVTVGTNTIEAYGQKYGSNSNCKFVAEVSGEYIIYGASQRNSPYIYLCDANGNILAQTSDKIIIDLEAGETYRIGAGNSNEAIEKMQLFVMAPVSITAQGNGGTYVGGGEYTYGDDVTVTATPNDGMFFVKWSDGENKNTYSLKAYANTTLNAEFNAVHQVVEGVNAVVGYYSGVTDNYNCEFTPSFSGPYVFFSESENDTYGVLYDADKNVLASDDNSGENGNFSFTYYLNEGETYYFAASYIYTGNAGEEMNFVVGTPVSVTASVVGNGSVQGAGMYAYGSNVTLSANPESGSRFVRWSDLSTANPYQFKIYEDIQLQALFADASTSVYTVSAVVNNSSYGSVSGGSNYIAGEEVTLTVTANDGYTFICWGDGETANPRIFSASENVSLMAILTREGTTVHTVSATANDANMGNVTGGRIYADGETATLSAEPVSGYKFVRWSNGSIDNPYSFTVAENTAVEALFVDASTPVYTVTVRVPSASANYGSVDGGGVFLSGETATLAATAAEHYQFVKWSNNETDNPLEFTVNSDVDLAAVFDLVSHNVTIVAENGVVTQGSGSFKYGTWATIAVRPTEHYHFVGWADGETLATRTEQVLGDMQFTALFEKDKYTISAWADNDATVSGTGEYEYEATATLTVTPNEGYHFEGWSDDATAGNPRQIVVDRNLDLYATTAINQYQVTVNAANGKVEGITNPYEHGSEGTFTAVPDEGYRFVRWSAANRDNPFTMQIFNDVVLSPLFASATDEVYDVVLSATEGGTVAGGGIFLKDEKTTITATPSQGYHFVKWSNGTTESSFELTVTESVNFKAEFDKNVHTLAVVAGANGTVTGGGTFDAGSSAAISATAAEGYHFVRWSDGNTNAERTITMNSDLTLTAEFAINTYAVTATAKNGKVEGAGTYNHGAEATLTAVANTGYHFTKWSDGVTTATRKVTVTSELSFTAEFEINSYTVTVSAANGTVEGAGTYIHGATATLNATAAEGYSFAQWSDGQKRAKRTVVVTSDTVFTAEFVANNYTVSASGTNGTVEGTGTYAYGAEATLTAVANTGYHFSKWSDGVETATRKETVKSNLSFTAEFAPNSYTISVDSTAGGTVTGAGTYTYGATATLEATANSGYHFVMWTDSVTTATRTIEVKGNATFSAVFAGNACELTVKAENGTVEGAGTYENGTEATLTAVADAGYIFSSWDDGNTDNPRTVTVTGNKTYTATFKKALYAVVVKAENGQITGAADSLELGATVTLTAIADEGYHFVMWSDSVTENPRTVTITAELLQLVQTDSIEFTAIFEINTAIADEAAEDVNIFAFGNTIVVENATTDIFIYDAMGRLINRENASAQRTEIQVNGAGVYIVKTGNTAKRVMIND